jgi:hypothetical protein
LDENICSNAERDSHSEKQSYEMNLIDGRISIDWNFEHSLKSLRPIDSSFSLNLMDDMDSHSEKQSSKMNFTIWRIIID